jgi:transcriptional antiterminator
VNNVAINKLSESPIAAFLARMGVPQKQIAEYLKCSTRTVRKAIAFWSDTETGNLDIPSRKLFELHDKFNEYIKII